ncbi:unnamed protein product [Closterium sp. NIES-64]|nr:unnamed protein product [Closterium sp. NIES-64]
MGEKGILRLQVRALRIHLKGRMLAGLKEVGQAVRSGRAKCVVLSPSVEEMPEMSIRERQGQVKGGRDKGRWGGKRRAGELGERQGGEDSEAEGGLSGLQISRFPITVKEGDL